MPPPTGKIETLSPNDVVSCLWNKNSLEKCRIGIADSIVYENGLPARWYVTGKTGEVVKKRGVELSAVSERWMRIAAVNSCPIVAILRQPGGILKILNAEAWEYFVKGPPLDTTIQSIHCFVKGSNNTVYRNKFELKDKLGRFATSTHSYVFKIDETTESVILMHENPADFTELKATNLKNIMDLATNTVVRYLEMMLGVKILSLSVDYVIDTKSQLWMMWTSEAKFVRSTNISEITIPGIHSGDKIGRMSWAGPNYKEGMLYYIY